ncbi:MBL fold metallo-hydrolase RNA specificity domain-containing protein [Desulforhabdus sp. TSK]|uniref:MBL fold metallo-hydrolase RNA specificity domain-containing protein n=1 Tax=Desulforhabdus sp. TSK TaxID=2925014 RepID=UPI001FC804CD|nr:MBL fold metallo-hydrolase [Desulforhabdus sp. TSK]GKT10653.1 MBL fold hydrolase [Desulforhabdus sp. TSK]
MKITCLGAAGCVTGSCFLLDNGKKYLVDCGLFQGNKSLEEMNRVDWNFNPREISALFLTHAHIDHSGRIPKLVKDGFKGRIYTSVPTAELVKILLLDSAHIQEMEAGWQTRKNRRRGGPDVEPLYTVADAEACFSQIETIPFDEILPLHPGLSVRFRNSGHILGSSILEVWTGPSSSAHKVVFSGDLGKKDQIILQDPHSIFNADTLFIESTYGNRNHKSFDESINELLEAINYSYRQKEKVIIPAFAVERTQEILYVLGEFFRKGKIPSMPVYLDSPLAIAATEIFRKMKPYYDEEAAAIVAQGEDPFDFDELIYSRTSEESIAINETPGPAIVIAGNGMCTAGRIKHHLKHNIWRKGSSLVIVGFQAEGTLGRAIIEGANSIRIFGEKLLVKAKVFTIGGFSAHADQQGLLQWLEDFENPATQVYMIHGEKSVSEGFAALVRQKLGFDTHVPGIGSVITLPPYVAEGVPEGIEVPEESKWAGYLRMLLQNAGEIKALWDKAPQALTPQMEKQLEKELAESQKRLSQLLEKAKKAAVDAR